MERVADMQPVRLAELASVIGLPKTTIQRNLETLAEAGWIKTVGGDTTRWAVSPRIQALIMKSTTAANLREAALIPMRRLRDVTGETVHLMVPNGEDEVVVIERVESDESVRSILPIGKVFPVVASSSGMAILARMDSDNIRRVITTARKELDANPNYKLDTLDDQISEIQKLGYCIKPGWRGDIIGVGAAVLDRHGKPIAGLSASFPVGRFDPDQQGKWGEAAMAAAQEISDSLDYAS